MRIIFFIAFILLSTNSYGQQQSKPCLQAPTYEFKITPSADGHYAVTYLREPGKDDPRINTRISKIMLDDIGLLSARVALEEVINGQLNSNNLSSEIDFRKNKKLIAFATQQLKKLRKKLLPIDDKKINDLLDSMIMNLSNKKFNFAYIHLTFATLFHLLGNRNIYPYAETKTNISDPSWSSNKRVTISEVPFASGDNTFRSGCYKRNRKFTLQKSHSVPRKTGLKRSDTQ